MKIESVKQTIALALTVAIPWWAAYICREAYGSLPLLLISILGLVFALCSWTHGVVDDTRGFISINPITTPVWAFIYGILFACTIAAGIMPMLAWGWKGTLIIFLAWIFAIPEKR